jgi:hypothetical protein
MRRTVDRELAARPHAARAADACADPALVADRLIAVLRRTPDGRGWTGSRISRRAVGGARGSDLAEAMGALAENAARHARSKVALSARAAKDGLHR